MPSTQNAVLAIGLVPFIAPIGSSVDHITVTAVASNPANSPPAQSLPGNATTCTFTNLAPDTYTFSAQSFPSTGAGYGSPVTTTLVVVSDTVTIQIVGQLSASQP